MEISECIYSSSSTEHFDPGKACLDIGQGQKPSWIDADLSTIKQIHESHFGVHFHHKEIFECIYI